MCASLLRIFAAEGTPVLHPCQRLFHDSSNASALVKTRHSPISSMRLLKLSSAENAAAASRRGTAAVEAAVVLPVYFLLLLGIVEFGHAQMVVNLLQSSCRAGARMGSTAGPTTTQVVSRMKEVLGAGVNASKVAIYVKDASSLDHSGTWPTTDSGVSALPALELSAAEDRQMFVVRASVPYNSIAIVPMPFLKNYTLSAQCFMRHE
jgi:Flp pilus assembly protein TadG